MFCWHSSMDNLQVLKYSQTKAEMEFYRKKWFGHCWLHKSSAVMQTINKWVMGKPEIDQWNSMSRKQASFSLKYMQLTASKYHERMHQKNCQFVNQLSYVEKLLFWRHNANYCGKQTILNLLNIEWLNKNAIIEVFLYPFKIMVQVSGALDVKPMRRYGHKKWRKNGQTSLSTIGPTSVLFSMVGVNVFTGKTLTRPHQCGYHQHRSNKPERFRKNNMILLKYTQ